VLQTEVFECICVLIQELQEQFWETLYPEIEDNDAGMRAMPIEWMANRVAALVREAPITKSGMNYYQYKESRTVGYEADAESSDERILCAWLDF